MKQKRAIVRIVPVACAGLLASTAGAAVIQEAYESRTISFAAGSPTTSGVFDPLDTFTLGVTSYQAWTRPYKVREINNTSGQFFLSTLGAWASGTGWSFVSAASTLSDNSIKLRTYDVQGTSSRIGCEVHVEYVPGAGDPTDGVHWIQVLRTNHSLTGGHGPVEFKLDNRGSSSPYYDDLGAATSREFYDFPGRTSSLDKHHYWDAELFLATGPAAGSPGQVTLYRTGLAWGWGAVPTPGTGAMLGLAGLVAARRRR
jgi:hypothetical protein